MYFLRYLIANLIDSHHGRDFGARDMSPGTRSVPLWLFPVGLGVVGGVALIAGWWVL